MNIDDLFAGPEEDGNPASDSRAVPFPYAAMADRLAEQASIHPGLPAVVDDEGAFTCAELLDRAGRIAAFLLRLNLAPETPVAVLTGRSRHHYAAVLGIWKAGYVSVPLDPSLPPRRLRHMLDICAVVCADAAHAGLAERLSFDCPSIRALLCLETPRFEDAVERPAALMALDLWDCVTRTASDASWKSFFTGLPLPAAGLDGMARHVCASVRPKGRVLDIGSGSGSVARALLAGSSSYVAVDLSPNELERIRLLGVQLGIPVLTRTMEARDIGILEPGFDCIVMNSAVECFPGCNYLRLVLDRAADLLAENGVLFVGMVWDSERRAALRQALHDHAGRTGSSAGLIRFDEEQELFVPRSVFTDWAAGRTDVSISFGKPASGIAELDDYRYDVIIRRTPHGQHAAGEKKKAAVRKRFGLADLGAPSGTLPCIGPDHAAYVIFTSGTTGMPRGVLVEHGGLMNLMENLVRQVCAQLPQPVRAGVIASFSFDASLQSWAVLCGGGTLFILSDEVRRDPQALHDLLRRRAITLCDGTPSLFGLLLDFWEQHGRQPSVACWLLGGEALRSDHLSRLYALPGQQEVRVINAYGPTECCVDATLHTFTAGNWQEHVSPPLGSPLKGVKIRIRDHNGRSVQDGLPGELWIGGIGVARGTLTETSPSPFVTETDGRWYRTGDVVCRQDGLLFFLSREDGQVKTGGYRVETAEVEAALEVCPLIRRAVVAAGDFSGNGVITLAAYFIPAGHETPDSSALRAYLANLLPAYAIPAFFIPMTVLPLSPSGKIDRRSLPSPTACRTRQEGRPPRGPMETALAELWAGLLGCTVNDATADFFSLGGHSVLAVRLASLMEQRFGRRVPLARLFASPTLAEQAALLAQPEGSDSGEPQILPLAPAGAGDNSAGVRTQDGAMPLFLFHPAGGSTYCYNALAALLDRPVYAVEPPPLLSRWPSMLTVEEMAAGYARAMLRVLDSLDTPYLLGGWSFGGLIAFETARLLRSQGRPERGLVFLDTRVHADEGKTGLDETDLLQSLLGHLPVEPERFRALPEKERTALLLKAGLESGRLPSGLDEERMRALIRTFQYNMLAAARYTPVRMPGSALLIRCRILGGTDEVTADPCMGWKECLDTVRLEWVNGTHESMLQGCNAAEVASIMRDYFPGRA